MNMNKLAAILLGFAITSAYAETAQGAKDSLDPDAFSYTVTSKEIA